MAGAHCGTWSAWHGETSSSPAVVSSPAVELGKRELGLSLLKEVNRKPFSPSLPRDFSFVFLVPWSSDTYSLPVRHPVELYLYLLCLTIVKAVNSESLFPERE